MDLTGVHGGGMTAGDRRRLALSVLFVVPLIRAGLRIASPRRIASVLSWPPPGADPR